MPLFHEFVINQKDCRENRRVKRVGGKFYFGRRQFCFTVITGANFLLFHVENPSIFILAGLPREEFNIANSGISKCTGGLVYGHHVRNTLEI
jgi:hypothetical protein